MTPAGSLVQGREKEFAALGALLDGVRSGPVEPLLLVGEAGMGKTALLDGLVARARRARVRVARTRSPQGADASPFAVVADLARGLADCLDALSEEDASVLGAAPRGAPVRPGRVATALLELLAESAHREPILLLLDDLHWADRESVAAVCLAAGRLQSERVAVVAAVRPRPPLDPRLQDWARLEVGPLEVHVAARVLREHLSGSDPGGPMIDDARAAALAEALGGCPLALVEAGRLLSAEQVSGAAPLPDPLPIDDRLMAAWGRAWSTLPEPVRTGVLALCVAGGSGGGLLTGVLADLGLGPDDLDPARSERLLVRAGAAADVELAHTLVRDAVLTAAGGAQVRTMHRRSACVAQDLGLSSSIVVAHLAASAVPGDDEAVALLLTHAERALAAGLGDTATHALATASALAPNALDRSGLAARAAEVLMEESLATADVVQILRLADPRDLKPAERFWVDWLRAEWLNEVDVRQALAAVDGTLALAAEIDSPMLPWIEFSAVTTAWACEEGETALAHARALRALADRPEADEGTRMPSWACRAMYALALFQVGQVQAAYEELGAARALSRRWRPTGHDHLAERLQALVVDAEAFPADPLADSRLGELARLLAGDPGETLGYVRCMQAVSARNRGTIDIARSLMDDAIALNRGSTSHYGAILILARSLPLAAVEGNAVLLRAQADELRAHARSIGWPRASAHADRAEGLLALAHGRLDEALSHLEPLAEPQLLGRGPWDCVPSGRVDLVEALVRAGEGERAAAVAAGVERDLGPSPDARARALVARSLGLVRHGARAREALESAIAGFREAGDLFEEARSRLLLGEQLRRDRQTQAARHELRAASAAFERMGATPWQARALGELRATRAAVPQPAADPWAELTPQERRVAMAVSRGASDRQVAAELFLSTRTVGYHLASVYRKLGISNRTALAARLAQAQSGQADVRST